MGCGCKDKSDPFGPVRPRRDRWLRAEVDRVMRNTDRLMGNGRPAAEPEPPPIEGEDPNARHLGPFPGSVSPDIKPPPQHYDLEKRMRREQEQRPPLLPA